MKNSGVSLLLMACWLPVSKDKGSRDSVQGFVEPVGMMKIALREPSSLRQLNFISY